MTTLVTRETLEDALYQLAPHKTGEARKVLAIIDKYAATIADRVQQSLVAVEPELEKLKPGETNIDTGMRCCASCGKVRNLAGFFVKDPRAPYGRKIRCIVCRPPLNWAINRTRADRYLCTRCGKHKPLSHFPEKKQARPKLKMFCLDCRKKIDVQVTKAAR
jgi:hypothetical protein